MRYSLFIFAFLIMTNVFGQKDRPKIGLVLSGGGARGMAHIGILKELEELGIRPDYVTGTSMGSVIGGLYAAGYSADEIEEIALSIDWKVLLSNQVELDKINYDEKAYYQRYVIELGLGKDGIELPKGLIEGHRLTEELSRLTRNVHSVSDFNNLPIPFACVATDIATGEPFVMNAGSLPIAIRASMAIPSVFTPIIIDDKLLVDGGLVRNFPVPECIDMGADIIIGVFVSTDLSDKDDLKTAVDVLSQSAFVMSAFDSRSQKERCDILIEPDLLDFSTMGFEDTPAIIAKGTEAAVAARPALKRLADSLGIAPPLSKIGRPVLRDTFLIANIQVEGNKAVSDEFVVGRLRIQENSFTTIDEIETRIDAVYGTRYFNKIFYEFRSKGDADDLIITVDEAPLQQVKLGLHYDTENKAGLNLNLTKRNLLPASRLLMEFDIAENPRAHVSFLKYLGYRQQWGVKLGGDFRKSPIYSRDSVSVSEGIFSNVYWNPMLSVFSSARRNSTYGLFGQFESSRFKPKVGGEDIRTLDKLRWQSYSTGAYFRYNNLNYRYFATRGSSYEASIKYSFAIDYEADLLDGQEIIMLDLEPENFVSLVFEHENRFYISPKVTLILEDVLLMNFVDRTGKFDNALPYYNDEALIGGFRPLPKNGYSFWGAEQVELNTDNAFINYLTLQYSPLNDFYIELSSQYLTIDYPMKWFGIDVENSDYYLPGDHTSIWGYGLMVSYASILGPVSFGIASHNQTTKWNPFFSIGFYF